MQRLRVEATERFFFRNCSWSISYIDGGMTKITSAIWQFKADAHLTLSNLQKDKSIGQSVL